MSDSKKEYKVVRNNCLDFKAGEIVELSDAEARRLVNKVELYVKPKQAARNGRSS